VEAGIAAACEWVAANLPLLAINLILTTDGELWALRYPEIHQLHILVREPDGPLDHASSLGSQVSSEHGIHRPLVVIASERMDKDRRWRALGSGELVHIDPELRVSTRTILREPPARPLTLADLGAQARASQASAAGPAAS
jgi:glutamine amidotransferase